MVNPASRQMSTNLVASSTPFVPHALKNSFPPPTVPVPNVRTGALKPEPPKNLYSIRRIYRFLRGLQACDRLRSQAQALRDIQPNGLRLSHGCENGTRYATAQSGALLAAMAGAAWTLAASELWLAGPTGNCPLGAGSPQRRGAH